MPSRLTTYREATGNDVAEIFVIRTAVTENLLTLPQLEAMGITPAAVANSLSGPCKGWIAEADGSPAGFAIANGQSASVFALFVLPKHQGMGIGTQLLQLAINWLWAGGATLIWLRTEPGSRAKRFYTKTGWLDRGIDDSGDNRFELAR